MKKYLLCCILCLVTALGFTGCSKASEVETDEDIRIPNENDVESLGEEADLYEVSEEELEDEGELVTSQDGVFQVLVPAGWGLSKNKIDNSMLFEIQGETEDQYMGILAIEKSDYVTMEASVFMDKYVQNAKEQYEDAIVGEVTVVDLVDTLGLELEDPESAPSAYTIKITGTLEEVSYINHVYVVDYEDETVVFTASAYPENEDAVVENLLSVVSSFGRVEKEEA